MNTLYRLRFFPPSLVRADAECSIYIRDYREYVFKRARARALILISANEFEFPERFDSHIRLLLVYFLPGNVFERKHLVLAYINGPFSKNKLYCTILLYIKSITMSVWAIMTCAIHFRVLRLHFGTFKNQSVTMTENIRNDDFFVLFC